MHMCDMCLGNPEPTYKKSTSYPKAAILERAHVKATSR